MTTSTIYSYIFPYQTTEQKLLLYLEDLRTKQDSMNREIQELRQLTQSDN